MAKFTHLNRENAFMTLRYAALLGVAAIGLTACSDDDKGTSAQPGVVNIRIVNSTYQDDGAGSFTPASIDVLFDSSTSAPSQVGMAPNSVAGGSVGPSPAKLNALYGNLPVGVHSHVARLAGGTTNPSFFTTPSNTQYLPKQYLTAGTYYTFIVAGINPPQTPTVALAASDAFPFTLLVDDPFTPPTTDATGSTVLQARFRVINAAPWAGGQYTNANVYLTDNNDIDISDNVALGSASYRGGSSYINATAKTYTLTITDANGAIVYQDDLVLGAGEVRTLILQNTGTVTGMTSDPTNYQLTNIQDNQY